MTLKVEHLLRLAVEAARRAVRDLKPDQIPASIQRAVSYSGGSLPPPFAKALLRELDRNEVLRGKALEAWEGDPPRDGPALASYRFLERGEGAWLDVAEIAHDLGTSESTSGDRELEIERDALAAEVAALKERLKKARAERDRAARDVREAARVARAPQRTERAEQRRLETQLEEQEAAHAVAIEQVTAERDRLEAQLREAQEASRVERKRRAAVEAVLSDRTDGPVPVTDSDALVEHLDALAATIAAAGPGAAPGERPQGVAAVEPLDYPGSVLPDAAEAVDWLAAAGALTVLIDGYNLGFFLASGRLEPGPARSLACEVAGRLARTAPEANVVAVFDSEIDADDTVPGGRAGFSVCWSRGRSADDEIVDRAAAAQRVVVFTDDRELRHRVEEVGAVALWSKALAEWSRRR